MKGNEKFSLKDFWSLFMSLAYMAIGCLVIFTPYLLPYNFQDNLPENDQFKIVRYILGIAMFLYGFYRGFKTIKSFF